MPKFCMDKRYHAQPTSNRSEKPRGRLVSTCQSWDPLLRGETFDLQSMIGSDDCDDWMVRSITFHSLSPIPTMKPSLLVSLLVLEDVQLLPMRAVSTSGARASGRGRGGGQGGHGARAARMRPALEMFWSTKMWWRYVKIARKYDEKVRNILDMSKENSPSFLRDFHWVSRWGLVYLSHLVVVNQLLKWPGEK